MSEKGGQNFSRNTRHGIRGSQAKNDRFSAKVNFACLISYESQKSEVDQDLPRKVIKSGFARRLRAAGMQLMGFEERLWPKMA